MSVTEDRNRMDIRSQKYHRVVNAVVSGFILLMLFAAAGGYTWITKIKEHDQEIAMVTSVLSFICDDMQTEDSNRKLFQVYEKKMNATKSPYFSLLSQYMTTQESLAYGRQKKCAALAREVK